MTDEEEPLTEICEGCSKTINEGDLHFRCDDGPVLCQLCAPTYADAEENMRGNDNLEPDDLPTFLASMQAHIAGGGSKHDTLPLTPL